MADAPATGISALARKRLSGRQPVTTDLSVDELALLDGLGLAPAGLVLGSSIYHVGWRRARLMQNMEIETMSQAMHAARELAVERMEAEAEACAADGVVGVRLVLQRPAWGPGLIEFLAVGTAVTSRDHRLRPAGGRPFASTLSGQDFYKLRRYGYRPTGLAFGCCVYHVAHLGLSKWVQQVGRNAEMEAFTQATYDAREIAMERMAAQAAEAQGEMVVGVSLSESTWGWDPNVIEFVAVGTAVVREAERPEPPAPHLVMGMEASAGALASLLRSNPPVPDAGMPRPGQ
jgi:uncharacterized protein YbjQ (UPF0145 family)